MEECQLLASRNRTMSESRTTDNKRHTLAGPIRSPIGDDFRKKDHQNIPHSTFVPGFETRLNLFSTWRVNGNLKTKTPGGIPVMPPIDPFRLNQQSPELTNGGNIRMSPDDNIRISESVVTQPLVSESSTFTTITTTESPGMDPSSPENIITCPIEELQSGIVKTESVMYNPNSKPCSPQNTTYVPVVETETCKVFYTSDLPQSPEIDPSVVLQMLLLFRRSTPLFLGEDILNTSSVSSKTRTVETITYKTEKDGVIETRVEKKITIHSDGDPIDHDQALAEAIHEATLMNPNLTVEKIEIQQQPPKQ
ncbi:protein 4.1 homolog [Caerostris extrusa]|uniref:Protein 4.1 homolog n=1 Tax=Caerostris extrusa TaxID=172846 RepID=A0AAV4RMK2_CAEEX|nr:protein 4.1 homolog [Caerostris extrusa]